MKMLLFLGKDLKPSNLKINDVLLFLELKECMDSLENLKKDPKNIISVY
jgi:hypothetical protein